MPISPTPRKKGCPVALKLEAAYCSLRAASDAVAASAKVSFGLDPFKGTWTAHHRGRGAVVVPRFEHSFGLGSQYVPGGPTSCSSLQTNWTGASLQLLLPSPLAGWPPWYSFPVPSVSQPWSRNWLGSVVQRGPTARKSDRKFQILVVEGRRPDMNELRLCANRF
eukprot:SAG31_NODE_18548_length_632_cov_1.005629_1_plen_165_part_00